ncbi:hypothetical protein Clacol_004233 [Clathrus columnatus]|uniref:Uncharacterized protein n=1 Tax=Clathrus columnatus TaxID=1419009 RepID=A0AAV5A5X6_9AGAM|nr:hypothetical protein Clacol_004233 [Clathrus columnatus]
MLHKYSSGQARVTIFAADGNARTFDYQAGDVGYVPFQDISLNQWLALTPPELVKAHLNIDDALIDTFSKKKQTVV